MNRLKDYLSFTVQFAGLGYIVMWPVSTPAGGDLFGASLVCRGAAAGAFGLVCRMPHPLQLGVGLHVAGAACAVAAALHLLTCAVVRARRGRGDAPVAVPVQATPAAVAVPAIPKPRVRRRPMPPPRKLVPPRTHFGLRGMPQ